MKEPAPAPYLADMKISRTAGLGFLLLAASLTATVAAQDGPPTPKLSVVPSPLVGYGIIAVLGGAIIAISLYSSKRERQDL